MFSVPLECGYMGTITGTISMLINYKCTRVFSSVGLERYLDRVEVMGSNPLTPTSLSMF